MSCDVMSCHVMSSPYDDTSSRVTSSLDKSRRDTKKRNDSFSFCEAEITGEGRGGDHALLTSQVPHKLHSPTVSRSATAGTTAHSNVRERLTQIRHHVAQKHATLMRPLPGQTPTATSVSISSRFITTNK